MSPENDLIVALSSVKRRFENLISSKKKLKFPIKLLTLFLKILLITVHWCLYRNIYHVCVCSYV
jgi:hypothetical protein